jgi:hypothetical protein
VLLGTRTKALAFRPSASAQARQLIGEALVSWGLDGVASNAQQCVSELVTDALEHGSPPVHLVVKQWTDAVQVTVIDWSEHHSGDGATSAHTESGIRWRIVDGLVSRWGVETLPAGRAAWFDIAVELPRSLPSTADARSARRLGDRSRVPRGVSRPAVGRGDLLTGTDFVRPISRSS